MSANLLYTDVEEQLRASVRELLTARCPHDALIAKVESAQPVDKALWRELAGLGVTSLSVPEEWGGQGAGARETSVVLEELGRSVAPVPFLGSAVLATTALLGCEANQDIIGLLTALANGEQTATLAVPLAICAGDAFPDTVRASSAGLTGAVTSVADATTSDVLVVPAIGDDGPELHIVRASSVTVTPVVSLDMSRPLADLTFENSPSQRVAGAGRAEFVLDSALLAGAGLLAAEQVGLAQWCLDTCVGYVKQRYQFGRPIGSFQAVKHRLADVWQELALARAAARYAADALAAEHHDVRVAVSVAQSLCAGVAVHAAEECLQLHGGIGMTWEHPVHLYLKRAKADQIALGTPVAHRRLLAPLADLGIAEN